MLNVLARNIPWFLGGAADLGPSTKSLLTYEGAGDFQVATRKPGTKSLPGEAPEVVYEPASRDLTILDLMTHTSGLISGGVGAALFGNQRERGDTLATYIPKLGKAALDFQPGTKWRYSGGAGIDTLGRIVEITSGLDFASFLKTRIFDPLGMKDTAFHVASASAGRFAACYSANGKGGILLQDDPTTSSYLAPPSFISGGGGLASTASDYLTFCRALLNGGDRKVTASLLEDWSALTVPARKTVVASLLSSPETTAVPADTRPTRVGNHAAGTAIGNPS